MAFLFSFRNSAQHLAAALCAIALCCGCRMSPEVSALQQESRQQQATIRDLKQQLQQTQQQLASQDLELQNFRDSHSSGTIRNVSVSETAASTTSIEQSSLWASVASIRIHRLTSGLIESDQQKRLRLIVQPLDADGEVVKVPGALDLVVSGISQPEIKKQWSLTESRSLWQWNLVATGFVLEIPISDQLTNAQLRCHVTYRLAKNRQFQTESTIAL